MTRRTASRPSQTTERPVVALYDGSRAALSTVHRAVTYGARTIVVGPPDAEERVGALAGRVDEWVTVRSPGLDVALDAAVQHGAPWACVPSTMMPTEDLLVHALQQAATVVGPDRRGFVLHVVRPSGGGGAPPPYRTVAGISDLEESSGVAVTAAASVAAHVGAELDVILLGVDTPVRDARELARTMAGRRDAGRFEFASEVISAAEVPVTFRCLGSPGDPVASALRHVERLRPDLLVIELGGQRLLRMGPLDTSDIAAALASSRGRLVANLLAWLAVDVAVVLDAVDVSAPEGVEDRQIVVSAIEEVLARTPG